MWNRWCNQIESIQILITKLVSILIRDTSWMAGLRGRAGGGRPLAGWRGRTGGGGDHWQAGAGRPLVGWRGRPLVGWRGRAGRGVTIGRLEGGGATIRRLEGAIAGR